MEEQTKATKWQGTADLNNPLPVSTEDFIKAFGYSGAEPVYLQLWDDTPGVTRGLPPKSCPARSIASLLQECHKYNKAERLAVGLRICGGGSKNADALTKGKARAQFMEIDNDSEGNKIPFEEQLQIIKQFALEPSIIVRTQKSLHTYWLLSAGSMKKFREIQERLQAQFASDSTLQDESQVMRLPGFLHQKGEPVLVQVIKFDPGIKYTQQELANLLPQIERKERQSSAYLGEITDTMPSLYETAGGRHNAMMRQLGFSRQSGANEQELWGIARGYNSTFYEPLPESELRAIIDYECRQQSKDYATRLREQQRTESAVRDFAESEQPEKKADFYKDFLQIIQTEAYKPYPTDCTFFDNLLDGGVIRQSLLLLLAAPGTGKTTLCQQLAEGMARKGKKVLYFNLEMSAEQMLAKAISCRLTRKDSSQVISTTKVLQGYNWTDTERERITKELRYYTEDTAPNIRYYSRKTENKDGKPDNNKMSLEKIMAMLTAAGESYKAKGEPAPAVVIDYLHLITSENARTDPAALLKEATDSFKQYAINYDTFVILICATNRTSNQSGELTLESGRDSSALEYTGDYVLSLQLAAFDRDILSPTAKKDKNRLTEIYKAKWRAMTLRVLKHRFGTHSKAELWYIPEGNIFYDADGFLPVDDEREQIAALLDNWEMAKKAGDPLPDSDQKSAKKDTKRA